MTYSQKYNELANWWRNTAETEIEMVVPKAIEYSAQDLADIGRTLASMANHDITDDEEATELGIAFYILGKIARWTGAIKEGRRVSDDTLLDIVIYAKMAQRNRQSGGWPFKPETKDTK